MALCFFIDLLLQNSHKKWINGLSFSGLIDVTMLCHICCVVDRGRSRHFHPDESSEKRRLHQEIDFFFSFFVSPLDKIFIFPMCVQVAAHAHTFTSSIGQEQKRLYVSVKHSGYKKFHPSLSNRAEWLIARIFSSSRGPIRFTERKIEKKILLPPPFDIKRFLKSINDYKPTPRLQIITHVENFFFFKDTPMNCRRWW